MARSLRLTYEGAVYHVTVRGNNCHNLFEADGDRERYLFSLAESLPRYDICFQRTACHYSIDEVLDAMGEMFDIEREVFMMRQHNSWLRPLCSRALQVFCGMRIRKARIS